MIERYELSTPRSGKDGKTYWTKVGVSFPNKDGTGFNLILEAYPLPDKEGRVIMIMRPPFEKDGERQADKPVRKPATPRQANHDFDYEIPF